MKKNLILFFCVALFASCQKDDNLITLNSNATPAKITSPPGGFTKIITSAIAGDAMEFAWNKTGYGVNTQVNYALQVDAKCGDFTNPVTLATTNSTSVSLTLGDLSAKLISNLKVAQNRAAELQLRVVSIVTDKYLKISEVVPVTITPYSDKPVSLWLGENSVTAPVVFATGDNTFEGYRLIQQGSAFRLSNSPACPDGVYGSNGAGKIASGATSPVTMLRGGYYRIDVDKQNLTLDTLFISTWGMIGTATPGGWDSSTPLTYSADKDIWQATLALTAGALKFRANNGWDLNFGPASSGDLSGTLIQTNDAITIPSDGNYTVTFDLSQTKSPYKYVYSVTPAAAIPEPAKLWVPGGYQSYKPDAAPQIHAINDFTYEGYVYISSPTGFKFTSAPDWVHVNYGDGGSGKLSTDGAAPDLGLSSAGYYKFKVDTKNLTYDIVLVNTWGMIGTATADGWNSSQPLTYNAATDVWSADIDLVPGALKFRANNDWGLNYGPAVIANLTGSLVTTNDAINITEAGSYTVTLDFSRSKEPWSFGYTVKKK